MSTYHGKRENLGKFSTNKSACAAVACGVYKRHVGEFKDLPTIVK
jgi:hypothetical protein